MIKYIQKAVELLKPSVAAALILVTAFAPLVFTGSHMANAAGDAYFSLSPASGSYTVGNNVTVSISETSSSGDNTNAVQANLSYPAQYLQYNSTSLNGPFTLCGQNKGGGGSVNLGCASSTTQSGTQAVAQISFTVLASTSSATISLTSGSDIDNTSGSSVLSSQALPSANYTFNAPTTSPPPSSPPPSTGSSGGSGSKSSSSKGSTTKPSAPSATTATPSNGTTATTTSLASLSVSVSGGNNKPVVGAKVGLDSKQFVYTNANGVADFVALTSGTHIVTVNSSGKTLTQTVVLQPGENKLISFKLSGNSLSKIIAAVVMVIIILALIILGASWAKKIRHNFSRHVLQNSAVTVSNDGKNPTKKSGVNSTEPIIIQPQNLPDLDAGNDPKLPEIRKNDLH